MNRITGTLTASVLAMHLTMTAGFGAEKQAQLNISEGSRQKLVGVGMGLSPDKDHNRLVVVGAPPGTPAAGANIVGGDVIVAVDGTPVNASNFEFAIQHIRGVRGTTVKLTVEHNNVQRDVTLSRVEITIPKGGGCSAKEHPPAWTIK